MAKLAAGAAVVVLILGAAWYFLVRDETVAPRVHSPWAVATIGSGDEAVAVAADGAIVPWLPTATDPAPPTLALSEPPPGGRVKGPALEQVRVLAAAPAALRPYLVSSRYGESGVDLETSAGIELRFGDDSQLRRKWKAAAAILADPEITELGYVDLHAPSRPSYGGSGAVLPTAP